MDKSDRGFYVFVAILFMAFSWVLGLKCAVHHERTRAIRAGAAHWYVDPETGHVEFRYKTAAP